MAKDLTLSKRPAKKDRERLVLFGLIERFLQEGKPIGSSTLQAAGFEDLSSATIRNYFASLEADGLLEQAHTSGGRAPTELAMRLYAEHVLATYPLESAEGFGKTLEASPQVVFTLHEIAEELSLAAGAPVFLSAPRFDRDFIQDVKFVELDHGRMLGIVITDFGVIRTEVLHSSTPVTLASCRRLEAYVRWRLRGGDEPQGLSLDEEGFVKRFYNELMARYLTGYASFQEEDIRRTGFSTLLAYPEYQDALALTSALSLLENAELARSFLAHARRSGELKVWIGQDTGVDCKGAMLCLPYHIHGAAVGAIGLLGPMRMDYRKQFARLRAAASRLSELLTASVYKHKIEVRQPSPFLAKICLENKRIEE